MDPLANVNRQYEQLLKNSREALAEDRQRKEAFESLVKHPGWVCFQQLLNKIIEERGMHILAPAGSMEGAIALEFVKGTMNGLILSRDLPSLIIESVPARKIEDTDE